MDVDACVVGPEVLSCEVVEERDVRTVSETEYGGPLVEGLGCVCTNPDVLVDEEVVVFESR